jgi:hypothetical protein
MVRVMSSKMGAVMVRVMSSKMGAVMVRVMSSKMGAVMVRVMSSKTLIGWLVGSTNTTVIPTQLRYQHNCDTKALGSLVGAVSHLQLLDSNVDRHERARAPNSGAAVHQDGRAAAGRVFPDSAQKLNDRRSCLGHAVVWPARVPKVLDLPRWGVAVHLHHLQRTMREWSIKPKVVRAVSKDQPLIAE